MEQHLWKKMGILTSTLTLISLPTIASAQTAEDILEQVNLYTDTQALAQVTSVSQLKDVSPTDWAYEALRSLVERYGCIVGYPDSTFRGNRALSRYEFAAGLNACMQQMERLIAASEAVLKEDIAKLQRLMSEFEAELAALGARVDNLEGRVAFLEDHQFSTTTKLSGEVVLALGSVLSGERDSGSRDIDRVVTFGNKVELELETSFTGEDTLLVSLETGNLIGFSETAGTSQAELAFDEDEDNDLIIETINYNFPITENITLWLEGAGGEFDDFTDTLSVLDGDGNEGALSVFGTRNFIYYEGEGAGLGIEGKIGNFGWSLGYLAEDASDPSEGNGLFNGTYGILGQVGYYPNDNFSIAFAYSHGYNSSAIGTSSGIFSSLLDLTDSDIIHNSYSVNTSWRINEKVVLGAWGGYSNVRTLDTFNDGFDSVSRGSSDFFYWAATLALPDLFKEGNLGGLIIGMQPWQSDSDIRVNGDTLDDDDTSFHVEAFYQYEVNENISITPGLVFVTNPANDDDNDALVIGTIRTTFEF
jgi:hypothetical protein